MNTPQHIGDGVYVSFDGYQIVICVNNANSQPVAYLPDFVMLALQKYAQQCWPWMADPRE